MNLYRGLNLDELEEANQNGFIKVKKDRYPRHSNELVHKYADEVFFEKFGIKFRSQSIFCTGYIDSAFQYGKVKCIEPIVDENSKICWSPIVDDFIDIEDAIDMKNITKEAVQNFIESKNYQVRKFNGLHEAIKSKNEIMVYCDTYKIKDCSEE